MAASTTFIDTVYKELAECAICIGVYDTPKILPCLHSFCLKCLEQFGRGKNPGSRLECPVCRQEFAVPVGSMSQLQGNFFLSRIVELYQATDPAGPTASPQARALCDACGFGKNGQTKDEDVASYCVECRQKICDNCARMHRQFAVSRGHQIVALRGDERVNFDELVKIRTSFCELHPQEAASLYCVECKNAICLKCFALKHKAHECEDIEDCGDKGRIKLKEAIDKATAHILTHAAAEKKLESEKEKLITSTQGTELAIGWTADELIRQIQRHKMSALEELDAIKQVKVKDIQQKSAEVEFGRGSLESFSQFARALHDNGTHAEVSTLAETMLEKACAFKPLTLIDLYAAPTVSFTASDAVTALVKKGENIVGRVSMKETFVRPTFTGQPSQYKTPYKDITGDKSILGVAIHKNFVYLCRYTTPHLEVYDADTYYRLRLLPVKNLTDPTDLATCFVNDCLYVNGQNDRMIFKVNPVDDGSTTWQMPEKSFRLSVAENTNVIVTFRETLMVREYDSNGKLLRTIQLAADMKSPRNAILMDPGVYAVCHGELGEPLHRVCIIDVNGKVQNFFGGPEGSLPDQMNVPVHMIRDVDGGFLVADLNNHRIHRITVDMKLVEHILTKIEGINVPRKLCIDHERKRLLISLNDGKLKVYNASP